MSRHSKFILVLMCGIFASLTDAHSQIKVHTFNPKSKIHSVLVSKDSNTYKFRNRMPRSVFKSPGWYSVHILKDTILYSFKASSEALNEVIAIYIDDIFNLDDIDKDLYSPNKQFTRTRILELPSIDPNKQYTMFYIEYNVNGINGFMFYAIEDGKSRLIKF